MTAKSRVPGQWRSWQFSYILLGTFWLWGPLLNPALSSASLISEYEAPGQPYAWLLRIADVTAACLLLGAALWLYKRRQLSKVSFWILVIVGVGMALDALIPITCAVQAHRCIEYTSVNFYIHAVETVVTAGAIVGLTLLDWIKRKAGPTALFGIFQLGYGALFLVSVGTDFRYATLTQFTYQALLILWLAWFVRVHGIGSTRTDNDGQSHYAPLVRQAIAVWAALNGILAIILSFHTASLGGAVDRFYIANDTAWLAQHSAITGLVLLYVSRHLLRGEHRARQLILLMLGVEVLMYAVVIEVPLILLIYSLSFAFIFSIPDFFERGTIAPNIQDRLRDIGVIVLGSLTAVALSLALISRLPRGRAVLRRALRFSNKLPHAHTTPAHVLHSRLLIHTLNALIIGLLAAVLWVLFRPGRARRNLNEPGLTLAMDLLKKYARSSEDYFKLWPRDKQYFFNKNQTAFIAYKVSGSIAFALGDPIASTSLQRKNMLNAFTHFCRSHGWRACFLLVNDKSLPLYQASGYKSLRIGASAIIPVKTFVNQTSRNKWWRWQKNRAIKDGYSYSTSQPPHSPQLLTACRQVSESWLGDGEHREQGFALGYYDKAYLQNCTIHYASNASGTIIAFTNQVPVFTQGQTTVDLMRFDPNYKNVMPFLLANVIEYSGSVQNFDWFDLGFVPLAKIQNPLVNAVRLIAAQRFSASGLERFKNKFEPKWQADYAAYDGDSADLALIALNLEKVMAPPPNVQPD